MANGECGENGVTAVQHVMAPEHAVENARAMIVVVLIVSVLQTPDFKQSRASIPVAQVCDILVSFLHAWKRAKLLNMCK